MQSMKYFLVSVYQVCSNKSPAVKIGTSQGLDIYHETSSNGYLPNLFNKNPWFKIGLGPGAYIQVSDFRAIMALLFYIIVCFKV
jgi:hypothetical protein